MKDEARELIPHSSFILYGLPPQGQPLEGLRLLALANFGFLDSSVEGLDALLIGSAVYRVGVTVFAAVGEGKAGWVFDANRSAMHQFADQAEGAESSRPNTFHFQERNKIFGLAFIGF